jgi:hypothetical protein
MVKVDCNGCEIYLDGYMKENLDFLKKKVKLKWDGVSLWVGDEGDGKTTMALQAALYLDPNLCLENITFNPEDFEEAVNRAAPFTSIVWDEADALGGHWANVMVQAMKRLMKRIRSKQLYIFLVTPTMFDLGKYFVIHRTQVLIHIYSTGLERGKFRMFVGDKKRNLYFYGYKMWNMKAERPNFIGSFTNLPKNFPIDMRAYEVKKDESTQVTDKGFKTPEKLRKQMLLPVFVELLQDGVPMSKISKYFQITVRNLYYWKRDLRGRI